jgi:hypothetical protein
VQTPVWIFLVIITYGIALPCFGYFFFRLIIHKTKVARDGLRSSQLTESSKIIRSEWHRSKLSLSWE